MRKSPKIKFVNLHGHSNASIFDGMGYPDEHMEFAYENGVDAIALTDHGNMSNMSYQVLHAKKMNKEGRTFKPVYGVEAYVLPCLKEWREAYDLSRADKAAKKKTKSLPDEEMVMSIEDEEETKGAYDSILKNRRHMVLLAQNREGLKNLYKLVSLSFQPEAFYRFPRMDYQMLKEHSEGVIGTSACLHPDSVLKTSHGNLTIKEVVLESKIANLTGGNIHVWSYNEIEARPEYKTVLWGDCTRKSAKVFSIKTDTGCEVRVTPDHKVFTDKGWMEARELGSHPGIRMLAANGCNFCEVTSINELEELVDVYDIEVEDNHNFFADGLLVHNCLGGTLAGEYWQNREKGREAVLEAMGCHVEIMQGIYGDRWYGELQWNAFPEQHEVNQYVIEVCEKYGVELISTADAHYPRPELWRDRELYKRLGWLGRKKDLDPLPKSVEELGMELYPKNGDQMFADYKKYSERAGFTYDDDVVLKSIERTHEIVEERIENFYPDTTVRLPDFVVPAGLAADEALRKDAERALVLFGKNKNREYVERLNQELDVIAKRDFSKYFLTTALICKIAKEHMLMGPGRGSGCGSLLAYLLEITDIDPLKYDLQFERFIRADDDSYPDLDLDFSRNLELKEILIDMWGADTVVPISNWNTLKVKSLVKDISKYYEIPFKEVNDVTGVMVKEAMGPAKKEHGITSGVYEPTYEEVRKYSPTFGDFLKKHPEVGVHIENLIKQKKSCGKHAGGVVIADNLNEHMPLIASGGNIQTPWTEGMAVRHLEPLGFIKFDLLGLSTLQMIEGAIGHILKRHHGIEKPTFAQIRQFYKENLHPDVIDLHDQEILSVFRDGGFAGTFQFTETPAQNFCTSVSPDNFIEIATITSIYRPGPLGAGVDRNYLEAKNDPDGVEYLNDIHKEITKETYGFLIYQEQIAALAHRLGKDISLDEGNLLRKVLTKKGTGKEAEVKAALYQRFIDGCVEKNIRQKKAEDLWKTFEFMSGYGFNLSHAVAYAMISYQCAFLLTKYPACWAAAYLDVEGTDEKKTATVNKKQKAINTIKSLGFDIRSPDINYSSDQWEISDDKKALYQPLTAIKGVGAAAYKQIIDHRPFNTIDEFLFHPKMKINKGVLDKLIRAQAMNGLVDERFSGLKHFWSAVAVEHTKKPEKFLENIELFRPEGEFSRDEKIAYLTDLTGVFPLYLVLSPGIEKGLKQNFVPPINEFDEDFNICWFIIRSITEKKTANGKPYWVLDVTDSTFNTSNIKCWGVNPKKDILHLNKVYMAKGLSYSPKWGFSANTVKNFKLLGA